MVQWASLKKEKFVYKDNKVQPDFVQRNLEPFVRNKSSKSWFVLCPFHPDRNSPSLSVVVNYGYKQPVGFWRCFGCGERGYWNKLAEALNMETVDGFKLDLNELDNISFNSEPEEIPEPSAKRVNIKTLVPWPVDRPWRGFSGKTILKYDGMLNNFDSAYPLVFLCRHRGSKRVKGFIRCRIKKKKGKKSYLFSRNTWISEYLWPENKIKKTDQLMFVEGLRDALAWLCRGIPTVATLGTTSGMGSKRRATLMGLGVEEIVLFMDGDIAGKNAVYGKWENNILKFEGFKSLLEEDFKVKIFKTWQYYPKSDPFVLAKKRIFVEKLRKWLKY